jgi:hypothetical protein
LPRYVETTEELLRQHGEALRSCVGETIEETWVAWDTRDNCWFQDESVIVCIAGRSLEIVCWKLSEISLSWDAVDRKSAPAWVSDWQRAASNSSGRETRSVNLPPPSAARFARSTFSNT